MPASPRSARSSPGSCGLMRVRCGWRGESGRLRLAARRPRAPASRPSPRSCRSCPRGAWSRTSTWVSRTAASAWSASGAASRFDELVANLGPHGTPGGPRTDAARPAEGGDRARPRARCRAHHHGRAHRSPLVGGDRQPAPHDAGARRRGTTIIFISHFLDEVLEVADVVTVMRDGRIIRTAPTAQETHATLHRGDDRP